MTSLINSSIRIPAFVLGLTLALTAAVTTSAPAHAKNGKDYFSQTYRTNQPLHGFEGRVGDYYCSYHRVPVHKIDPKTGRMKVVAWELRQHCY